MVIKGITAVGGMAFEKALILKDRTEYDLYEKSTGTEEDEINRLKSSVAELEQEFGRREKHLIENNKETIADIVEMHSSMLTDDMYLNEVIHQIRKGYCSETAVQKATNRQAILLKNLDDPYLSERALDIKDVGEQLIYCLKGEIPPDLSNLTKDVIVLAKECPPSVLTNAKDEHIKGLVIEKGSKTSHASIMAASLGIPMIIECEGIQEIKEDDLLFLDGQNQSVHYNLDETKKKEIMKQVINAKTFKN